MKTYIFKKEFMKNIYTTNFITHFPVNHYKKFFNFLDGIQFSLNTGIQNYSGNRLVMVSASFLDRPLFNTNYDELFAKYAKNLLSSSCYINIYGEDLIKKVSKKELTFSEIIKKSVANEYFLHSILQNIKEKKFLIVTENLFQKEAECDNNKYIYYIYDITGLNIEEEIELKLNKELEKDGLFKQFNLIEEKYIGNMYINMVLNERIED